MAKIQKNFIKGRMNKSVDERLVPQGEYIDALNVRLGSTRSVVAPKGVIKMAMRRYSLLSGIFDSGNWISTTSRDAGRTCWNVL